jgi:hypothetical protein
LLPVGVDRLVHRAKKDGEVFIANEVCVAGMLARRIDANHDRRVLVAVASESPLFALMIVLWRSDLHSV